MSERTGFVELPEAYVDGKLNLDVYKDADGVWRGALVGMKADLSFTYGGRIIVAFYWDDLRQWVSALAEVGRAGRVRDLGRELERIAHELKGVK